MQFDDVHRVIETDRSVRALSNSNVGIGTFFPILGVLTNMAKAID
jgi:hypothetical protein